MTAYKRGDVVLLRYTSPDGAENGLRPAVVVSSETYHLGRGQVVLAAATSNLRAPQPGDTAVQHWEMAGLKGPTLVTGVLLTAPAEGVAKRLGTLSPEDLRGVEASLRLSLGM
ncbi:MAG: type II toxin-antitoxin system PemK/MazF family toxin [Chloroflexi bacterium]|nr:type II toxin-antitoxin system PemK/MazF family toxin [Chloroflexota bacterium]